MDKGRFIAAVGLPGVGKSAVFAELARDIEAILYAEPEEPNWGQAVREREVSGHFTGLMWFRAQRVPMYFAAAATRASGRVALLDSYYDKLCVHWLGRPGLEWLLAPSDPYFAAASAISHLDRHLLPLADTLVVMSADEDVWLSFIRHRGRRLDMRAGLERTFETQSYFVEAAEQLAHDTGIELVHFRQDRVDSPRAAATRLRSRLDLAEPSTQVRTRPSTSL